jgi:hypothetical protein
MSEPFWLVTPAQPAAVTQSQVSERSGITLFTHDAAVPQKEPDANENPCPLRSSAVANPTPALMLPYLAAMAQASERSL